MVEFLIAHYIELGVAAVTLTAVLYQIFFIDWHDPKKDGCETPDEIAIRLVNEAIKEFDTEGSSVLDCIKRYSVRKHNQYAALIGKDRDREEVLWQEIQILNRLENDMRRQREDFGTAEHADADGLQMVV